MKDKYKSRESIKCHDCGAKEGQIHAYGCDMERCPFCQGQLISCDCMYKMFGLFDTKKYTFETYFLPPDIYKNGASDEQYEEWFDTLVKKGRIPYIEYPLICCLCGKLWPDLFMDDRWDKYIQPDMQDKILCKDCFDYIVEVIDNAKS